MPIPYSLCTLGDQGLTIELGTGIDESTNQRCLALAQHITRAAIPGIRDVIAAYSTVSVIYDAMQVVKELHSTSPSADLRKKITELIANCEWRLNEHAQTITIPACFDVSAGFDLEHMSEVKGIAVEEIVRRFTSVTYRVYMIGFLPGFAYMGKVDDLLAMPRKEKPHASVPAGSIGIAGHQAGIYPLTSPGGWNIVGRTALKMFDIDAVQPSLLKAGDHVRFEPVSRESFHQLNQQL
jgi:inhibitor of KinA